MSRNGEYEPLRAHLLLSMLRFGGQTCSAGTPGKSVLVGQFSTLVPEW